MYEILVKKRLLDTFTDKTKDIKEDVKIKHVVVRRRNVHDKERDIFISLTH